jgi:hypothetical protein
VTYDVGDYAPLQLLVEPFDETTNVTVEITDPRGAVTTAYPDRGEQLGTFVHDLLLTIPGVWIARWAVTGTGAGAEPDRIRVRPGAQLPS